MFAFDPNQVFADSHCPYPEISVQDCVVPERSCTPRLSASKSFGERSDWCDRDAPALSARGHGSILSPVPANIWLSAIEERYWRRGKHKRIPTRSLTRAWRRAGRTHPGTRVWGEGGVEQCLMVCVRVVRFEFNQMKSS